MMAAALITAAFGLGALLGRLTVQTTPIQPKTARRRRRSVIPMKTRPLPQFAEMPGFEDVSNAR